jgi:capsular polysaccharide biosynthesis protein
MSSTDVFVYRNPLALPRIDFADIINNTAEGVYVEPPGGNRVYRLKPPVFHDDPDSANVFPPLDERDVVSPPFFTVSLRNATVSGFRTVSSPLGFLTNDLGHVTEEQAHNFQRNLPYLAERTGLALADSGSAFGVDHRSLAIHLEGPVVVLTSAEAGNYGSFIFRELVKLINLYFVPPSWRFLLHISTGTFFEFLNLVGIASDRIIRHDPHQTYTLDQAIIPGIRSPLAVVDSEARDFYRKITLLCQKSFRKPRVYIARSVASAARRHGRVMLNEPELIEELRKLDFDILEAENRAAAEQVATFTGADFVIGASGSGIFNAVFCRPGTKIIDIESEPHWALPIRCLLDSSELPYVIFEAMAQDQDWSVHHKPFEVNITALVERIQAMITA